MTDAILNITDGTTTISLINPSSGFHLINWVPAITDYKGGGVFQDPPLADWRQLRVGKWATAQENFGLHVNGANPDNAAYELQEIRRLLLKANDYWNTDWQNTPVYLEAKAKCETNTRYCLVVKGRLGNDRNFYNQPFTGNASTLQDLPLEIERRAWLSSVPGVGIATEISNLETFNEVIFGTVDDTGAREPVTGLHELYLGNRQSNQNFTHIFNYDDSLTSFSANLLDTIPMTLFPASTAVNDIVYFGIQTSITNAGPIHCPIVFDLSTPASSTTSYDITWEYWSGATWTAPTTGGDQEELSEVGIGTVSFNVQQNQATTSVNGVTGYWFRARLSALTGTFTRPIQQNRNPYIANWPYFEVQSDQIGGDITALARMLILDEGTEGAIGLDIDNILIGLRSISRGSSFTPYINASTGHNPSGITVTASLGSITANNASPSGNIFEWTPGSAMPASAIVYFAFDATISTEYYGRFRILVRAKQNSGSAGDIQLRISFVNGLVTNALPISQYKTVQTSVASNGWGVLDFEEISLPGGKVTDNEILESMTVAIDANVLATGGTLQIADIILIPVDEFALFLDRVSSGNETFEGEYIDVDSINYPKYDIRANKKNYSDNSVIVPWQTRSNNQLISQANTRERYWFFFNAGDGDVNYAAQYASIQVQHVQRYLSLRGNR